MAVAPPFDKLTKLPAIAIDKLNVAQAKLIDFLKQLADKIIKKAAALSGNIKIKCSNPIITEIKQLLEKVKQTIDRILEVLGITSTVVVILNVTVTIASTTLGFSLANPIPQPEAGSQTVRVLNTIITNIISAIKLLSVFLPIVTGAIAGISATLGAVINKLGSICSEDTFEVNTATAINMLKNIDNKLKENSTSKFYRTVNVSQEDIDNRAELVDELIQRNTSIISNLLEAPSKVLLGNTLPVPEQGKTGDYFINETARIIYGPKVSDSDWGMAINY